MRGLVRFGLLGVLLLGLTACGGSGGGGPTPLGNGTFAGTYAFHLLSGDSSPESVNLFFGEGTANGAGALTGTSRVNASSLVSVTVSAFDYDYDVDPDGRMIWTRPGLTTHLVQGGLAPGGALLALSTPDSLAGPSGAIPNLVLMARRGSGFTLGTLNGPWHTGRIAFNNPTVTGVVATHTFDGAGAYSRSVHIYNEDGAFPVVVALGANSYIVAPDGSTTMSEGSLTFQGQIIAGGDAAIVGGGTTNNNLPLLRILIRKATSAGMATLSGEYWALGIEAHLPGAFTSYQGTLTADGGGVLSLVRTINDDGNVSVGAPALTGSYTVATDGRVDYAFPTIGYRGAVTADGRYAFMGGASSPLDPPALWILIRK